RPHGTLPHTPSAANASCRACSPGGLSGCTCRLLPRLCSLPQLAGGSASALSLSKPAQALLTLRPPDRSAALRRLCRETPTQPVTRPSCSLATGPIDNFPG